MDKFANSFPSNPGAQRHVFDGRGILSLYPHQQDLMRRSLAALMLRKRVMAYMATGGGKTETAFSLIEEWLRIYPRANAHFVAHRRELVSQPCVRALRYGIIIVNAWRPSGSVYTSARRHANSVAKMLKALATGAIKIAPNDLLVIDEAHHAVSATQMGKLALAFAEAGGLVVGFSATPWRLSAKQGFTPVFDELVLGPQTSSLVANKYLATPIVSVPRGSLAQMRSGFRRKDFTATGNLKDSALTKEARWSMLHLPLEKWFEYGYEQKRTIWFEQSTEMAVVRARQLRDLGVSVGLLLSDSKDERIAKGGVDGVPTEREEVLKGYGNGDLQCLVNISMVGEGLDVADTECVTLNFLSLSLSRVMQAIGRALRLSPGKDYAYVIDTGANTLDPQIGGPMHDREWSLQPRSTTPPGIPPELARCVSCDLAIHSSARVCPVDMQGCGKPQGEKCPRCFDFRRGFFPSCSEEKMCVRCEREERIRRSQGLLSKERGGTYSRQWAALGEDYGTALSREIVEAAKVAGEWGVIVDNSDGMIANGDYVDDIRVTTRSGSLKEMQGYAVWVGQFFDMPRAAMIVLYGVEGYDTWRIITDMSESARQSMIARAKSSQDSWITCAVCHSNMHLPKYPFCRNCRYPTSQPSIPEMNDRQG